MFIGHEPLQNRPRGANRTSSACGASGNHSWKKCPASARSRSSRDRSATITRSMRHTHDLGVPGGVRGVDRIGSLPQGARTTQRAQGHVSRASAVGNVRGGAADPVTHAHPSGTTRPGHRRRSHPARRRSMPLTCPRHECPTHRRRRRGGTPSPARAGPRGGRRSPGDPPRRRSGPCSPPFAASHRGSSLPALVAGARPCTRPQNAACAFPAATPRAGPCGHDRGRTPARCVRRH